MDTLAALEDGKLPPPVAAVAGAQEVGRSAEVACAWAQALGLRPGNTRGPSAAALVPVVDRWAAGRGWTGPGHRDVGRGLTMAGLYRRTRHGTTPRVLLHHADAARLTKLAREAWAPALPPGDTRRQKRKAVGGAPRRLTPPPQAAADFHEERLQLKKRARPLVDSQGRVWPAPSVAAKALGGSRKALNHAVGHFRHLVRDTVDASPLRSALAKLATWRGVWWRYLTPSEVAAIPPGTRTGDRLPGFGWGLTCQHCGACPTPAE